MDFGFIYFAQVLTTVTTLITNFSTNMMTNIMGWVSAIAITLFTVYIIVQGYRVLTGQSRESMMILVTNMSRTGIILIFATTVAFTGGDLQWFVNNKVLNEINSMVSGSPDDPSNSLAATIDKNLAYTQVAMALIEGAQGLNTTQSGTNAGNVASATFMAGIGLAGPPMTAGALLLTYQIGLALFIGLGPLFIMCLAFDQTKSLFQGWLMYGLGTMFSMAVLNVMVSIVMKITLAVAMALWVTGGLTSFTVGNTGLNNMAMQQGGIGLLMTALIISAPAMAGRFFSTLTGEFRERSGFDGVRPDRDRGAAAAAAAAAGGGGGGGGGGGNSSGGGHGGGSSSSTSPIPRPPLGSFNAATRSPSPVNRDVIAGPDKGDSNTSNMA